LVKWNDYSHEENTCETDQNGADSNPKLLEEYYQKNPKVEQDGRFGKEKQKKKQMKQK